VRVLVVFAVDAEFAPWRKLRDFELVRVGMVTLYRTQIGRASVDFVVSGMGPENARCVSELAMSIPHGVCIASGFAGSLKVSHKVGDILVAQAVRQRGTSKVIECSEKLYASGLRQGAAPANIFLTTDKVVNTAEEKKQLSPSADAVDMESFTILSIAKEHNLPGVAIRVITDQIDEAIPPGIDTIVDARGHARPGQIVRYVAAHPLKLSALIRLGRRSRIAAASLAKFLEAYIQNVSLDTEGDHPVELVEISAT